MGRERRPSAASLPPHLRLKCCKRSCSRAEHGFASPPSNNFFYNYLSERRFVCGEERSSALHKQTFLPTNTCKRCWWGEQHAEGLLPPHQHSFTGSRIRTWVEKGCLGGREGGNIGRARKTPRKRPQPPERTYHSRQLTTFSFKHQLLISGDPGPTFSLLIPRNKKLVFK